MMASSIINKGQLEGASRLDAEYYQPEYLESTNILHKTPVRLLSDLSIVTDGNHLTIAEQFVESGVRYLRGKDLQDFFVSDDDPVYVPNEAYTKLKRSHIFKEDVLVSIVGTVGSVSIVAGDLDKLTGNCKIAILHSKEVNPWFLAAFLAGRYGQNQIQRKVAGAVQTGIILKDLSNIEVPILSKEQQEEIRDSLEESYRQQLRTESLYQQAEDLLLEELGLKDFKIKDDLFFTVNASYIKSENRSDSDFFQPKYDSLIKRLQAKQLDLLETNFEIIKSKSFEYDDEGEVGVIKTKQLGKQFISFEVEDKVQQEIAQKEKLPTLMDLDVIFASMGVGSLGKTNIYYAFESEGKYTIDSTLRIFRKKNNGKILPEVLAVYLSSWVGQELIYKYVVGTSGIISIYENYLQNFLVPILSKETQQKIAELVRKSHEARKKSKQLLEDAKRKVEEMIEKGGNNGQN